jgi:DNA helicase II / ATP-dependent DNA helicase PcrA
LKLNEFLKIFIPLPNKASGPDEFQTRVISHGDGPLWVIAGPGSGKTDSIVLRCLKLMTVDGVLPRKIVVTTFTDKAARNIEDRIATHMRFLAGKAPQLRGFDYTRLRVGTLHSLCNDIMQEFRYREYQNYRLLSDMEQRLFITEHSSLAAIVPPKDQLLIWQNLPYLAAGFDPVTKGQWRPGKGKFPNRWTRAKGAQILFNRIVEERVDVARMRAKGDHWALVADAYEEYRTTLFARFRCDFAHLQLKFLDFLASSQGTLFLGGDGTDYFPGISHVLVDEYQDTNPIQEEIYLSLASAKPHNLCVVGDDDQALYRFRGGTVDCMVNFDSACKRAWNEALGADAKQPLPVNYRSHEGIVKFFDEYIQSFAIMKQPGARAPGKQSLQARSGINGTHPSVSLMTRNRAEDVANAFAEMIAGLRQQGTISHWSECALLMRTTKARKTYALPFMQALAARNIPVYNPRSRALLEAEEIQTALGAFLEVIDPDRAAQQQVVGDGIRELADDWRSAYQVAAGNNPGLEKYVKESMARVKTFAPTASVGANISEVLYHILSYSPFPAWLENPESTFRLGVATQVFEAFSNVPPANRTNAMLGDLYTSSKPGGGVGFTWRKNFYYSLLGILASEGLNEPEDQEEHMPLDMLPIMTVHQAKGLQFPFVFVYGLTPNVNFLKPDSSVMLESELQPFRKNRYGGAGTFTPEQRVQQDLVRFYYVAYSRAQYALVLLSTQANAKKPGMGFGGGGTPWLMQHANPI